MNLSVLFSILAVTLTACISTFQDIPPVDFQSNPIPKKDVQVYYYGDVDSWKDEKLMSVQDARDKDASDELKRVMEDNRIFSQAVPKPRPPEKGIYLSVQAKRKPRSRLAEAFTFLSVATLFVVPHYTFSAGYFVAYEIYIDNELKKKYQYEITQKGVIWIALLPFAWVNAFTNSGSDAFRATAYHFLLDAQRDGYF